MSLVSLVLSAVMFLSLSCYFEMYGNEVNFLILCKYKKLPKRVEGNSISDSKSIVLSFLLPAAEGKALAMFTSSI